MPNYQKTMRRLISHPGCAIGIVRRLTDRRRKCCPLCGVVRNPEIHHTDQRGVRTYRCRDCGKTFTELRGTLFHQSKVPLSDWLLAILYWATATGGLSAADLGRKLGVSHRTAWRMLMGIRGKLTRGVSDDLLEMITEADEAWFGRGGNQEIVMGIVQRGRRRLRLIVIPDVREATLYPHIRDNVKKGSKFFTDSRVSYAITGIEYHHQVTNHSAREFARGEVHSNTIEQIWGDIKGIIRTIHHGVSRKYRHLYLGQYVFQYENRHSSNMFFSILCQIFSPTYCLI